MGLFNRKSKEERYKELYDANLAQIKNANYLVRLDFAVGQYGNEDIVAGAMIGSTGKYLMMSKYGDLKWDTTTMALLMDGVEIHYNGTGLYYSDILDVRVSDDKGLFTVDKQLVLVTKKGDYIFKGSVVFVDVIVNLIVESRERYLGWVNDGLISAGESLSDDDVVKLINGESLVRDDVDKGKVERDMDRLIRLGELHERGLLSDEEFAEAKRKLL